VGRTPLEREIEDAYARYWQVRKQAYLSLEVSLLAEVTAGEELQREERQIGALAAQGRAARLTYEHRPSIREVSADRALVFDELVNHSVFVTAATGQELPTNAPPQIEKVSHEFRKIGGRWKVVDGVVHD